MESHARYLSSELWQLIFSRVGDGDLEAVSLVSNDFFTNSYHSKQSLKVVHPNIDMLSGHLTRFTGLKAIDLLSFEGDIEKAIGKIEGSGISLESLDIPIDKLRGDHSTERLRRFGPNLKALNCRINSDMDDKGVEVIANTFPDLEKLRIELLDASIMRPVDFGFKYLASKLKLLKKIHLSKCRVSDGFLVALSLNCVLLKDVTVRRFHNLTGTGVGHLLRNSPDLEALSIDWIDSYRPITIENSISHVKALTSLVIGCLGNTDRFLMNIANAKLPLNNLALVSCKGLTATGLLMVLSDHLAKLRIEEASITDEAMEAVVLSGDVSKLTHIEINDCKLTESTLFLLATKCSSLVEIRMKLDRQGLIPNVPLSINHNTKSLCLAECQSRINDETVKKIGLIFPNLKVLDLSRCWRVTTTGIEAILECCKQIRELILIKFQCTQLFEASNSSNLPNLEVLNLSLSRINDAGLVAISKKCPRTRAWLHKCNDRGHKASCPKHQISDILKFDVYLWKEL